MLVITSVFLICFTFGCTGSPLLCAGFLSLRRVGTPPEFGGGFSGGGVQALGAQASVAMAHGISSCGSGA